MREILPCDWPQCEDGAPLGWPWDAAWWKPKDHERDLVRAGALYLAEQERLRRLPGSFGLKHDRAARMDKDIKRVVDALNALKASENHLPAQPQRSADSAEQIAWWEEQCRQHVVQIERCMDMLGDVPGATLEDRLTHYVGSYMALQLKVSGESQTVEVWQPIETAPKDGTGTVGASDGKA